MSQCVIDGKYNNYCFYWHNVIINNLFDSSIIGHTIYIIYYLVSML